MSMSIQRDAQTESFHCCHKIISMPPQERVDIVHISIVAIKIHSPTSCTYKCTHVQRKQCVWGRTRTAADECVPPKRLITRYLNCVFFNVRFCFSTTVVFPCWHLVHTPRTRKAIATILLVFCVLFPLLQLLILDHYGGASSLDQSISDPRYDAIHSA